MLEAFKAATEEVVIPARVSAVVLTVIDAAETETTNAVLAQSAASRRKESRKADGRRPECVGCMEEWVTDAPPHDGRRRDADCGGTDCLRVGAVVIFRRTHFGTRAKNAELNTLLESSSSSRMLVPRLTNLATPHTNETCALPA